jgi:hypothetical protein
VDSWRVDRATVAVQGRASPHPSLQRGLHQAKKQDGARFEGASRS